MKKHQLILLICALSALLQACKKDGALVTYPSFGRLKVTGLASSPLNIAVDGKVAGTLNAGSDSNFELAIEEGERKISLIDSTNKSVVDTTLKFTKGVTTSLANFFYNGSGVLFPDPDTNRRPTPGHALVRFVITDKSLPNSLTLDIIRLDFATGEAAPVTHIEGVTKSDFSGYIELPQPESFDAFYVIEGTDAAGNKVMSIESGTYGILSYDTDINVGLVFVPDAIISLGIGPIPADGSLPFHNPEVIFKRIANH